MTGKSCHLPIDHSSKILTHMLKVTHSSQTGIDDFIDDFSYKVILQQHHKLTHFLLHFYQNYIIYSKVNVYARVHVQTKLFNLVHIKEEKI